VTARAGSADVVIVGGGLAGLSAAVHLQRAGVTTTICEAGDDIGGRVRTDYADGFLLDRGFQVLLPAYPELRRQASISALRLRPFLRGMLAMTASGRRWLAVPWNGRPAAADAARFLLGHPGDSAAMATLSLRDALSSCPVIRAADPVTTTGEELRGRFSAATIGEIMRPFLAGVFLDPALDTPARLFHLIWRCFLRGGAALPEGGMQMLPRQLAARLPAGTVRTGTTVTEVSDSGVRTAASEKIRARAVVIATDGTSAARLAPGLAAPQWHPVTTFYYRLPASPLGAPALIIDGTDELLLNTAVLSDVAPGYAPAGDALVTASVPGRADPALEPRVRSQLARLYDTGTRDWELLNSYAIPHALPVLPPATPLARPVRLAPGRYVCGDHRDTPSIQGALVSGRRAAQAVLTDLRKPG
jgi:phytoene dehydrogenase-like protein